MALKSPRKQPKVQRGVSLDRDLYERIQADADRLGMTWNEVVEGVLGRAFPVSSDLHNKATRTSNKADDYVELDE